MERRHTGESYFEKAYSELNAEQKEAVDHTEGPVLVLAGPGTGKTQILAARIARILQQTDARPENILCLTYTDAGTIAMRTRLLSFIGPDAYRVPVFTFHAFCNMVIQDNLDLFGVHDLQPVSELEKISILRNMVDELPRNHPLKRYSGDPYFECSRLNVLFDIMKREYWTPARIAASCAEYVNSLSTRPEYIYKTNGKNWKKGDLKQVAIDEETQRMTALTEAATLFDVYEQKLAAMGRYDFSDMIIRVIHAFRSEPFLLRKYQELYHYFLVDEFQDTSGSQNQILSELISYWDSPNVFVVGDEDQSIYRFQGANVENIKMFMETFASRGLLQVLLAQNYRSTQPILDAAKSLIDHNQERLSQKTLISQAKEAEPVAPQLVQYFNAAHESAGIAEAIRQLTASGVACRDIAVLYRNHSQADELLRYLEQEKIPVHTRRPANVLEEPLIKKFVALLTYLSLEIRRPHSGEAQLFTIMHFDFFSIDPLDIATISVQTGRKNYDEKKATWREALRAVEREKPDLFGHTPSRLAIGRLSRNLENWIRDAVNLTLQELIEKVITQSGILSSSLAGTGSVWNMQLLNTFFNFVKQETARDPRLTLNGIIETIELMHEHGVALPLERIVFSDNGVNFLTAHGSKGLEFRHVFLMGCTAATWDKPGRNRTYKFPDNLVFKAHSDETEETRRLFYVGMTRAASELVISYPAAGNNGKPVEKSRFVAELEAAGLNQMQVAVSDPQLMHYSTSGIRWQEPGDHSIFDKNFIASLLQTYALSVTHLNTYLHCPVSFYFNHLLRVPAAKSAALTFGSAVHYALEFYFKKMLSHQEKLFPTPETLIRDFRYYMKRHEESFTDAEFKRRVEYAEEFLPMYHALYAAQWNRNVVIEKSYRNVQVDGIPLSGKLDKIETDGKTLNVVDYKTGQYEKARPKFARPSPEKAAMSLAENREPRFEDQHGGDYWRQAVFYRILVDTEVPRKHEEVTVEFDFVEPDRQAKTFAREKVIVTDEDVKIVRGQMRYAWDGIRNGQFEKGCGKEDCDWCTFLHDYSSGRIDPHIQLTEPEETES
jgi:DNA helicase-2/ATP-dependent DNA helicase PcrA